MFNDVFDALVSQDYPAISCTILAICSSNFAASEGNLNVRA